MSEQRRRVMVLGAGPIGLEAALAAAKAGHQVSVLERGRIAEHVRRWGHVRLFSPWSMNRSAQGIIALQEAGLDVEVDEEAFPTGDELVRLYLEPLSKLPELKGRITTRREVMRVARARALKGDHVGSPQRGDSPFLVLARDLESGQEYYEEADVVIDATGSYRHGARLGPGGLSALGEEELAGEIERYVPDLRGSERERYEGARVLVIGAGYSAVTTLRDLEALHGEALWLRRDVKREPYEVIEGDVLPQRAELARFGNAAARGEREGIMALDGGQLLALKRREQGGVIAHIARRGEVIEEVVDRVVANVGYRPDVALFSELQVHLCYASDGPMKLAASLLAAGGGGGDCLAQPSTGAEVLLNPEPGFFVLGAKSYGRGSAFLLRLGHEQVKQVMGLVRAG